MVAWLAADWSVHDFKAERASDLLFDLLGKIVCFLLLLFLFFLGCLLLLLYFFGPRSCFSQFLALLFRHLFLFSFRRSKLEAKPECLSGFDFGSRQ